MSKGRKHTEETKKQPLPLKDNVKISGKVTQKKQNKC